MTSPQELSHCNPKAKHIQGQCALCDYYQSLSLAKAVFPHCDAYVLHAPGECEYCDDYASDIQKWRLANSVNFTGENDPNKKTCPATARRDADKIHQWHGNVPQPKTCPICKKQLHWIQLVLSCVDHGPV
jgi:hypothetical protein